MTGLIANALLIKKEEYPKQYSEDIILQSTYPENKRGEVEKGGIGIK